MTRYFSRTILRQWNFVWRRKKIVQKSADKWRCKDSHCLDICKLLIYDMRTADIADIKQQSTSCLFECFIMTLTMKDPALLLKLFYKNDECAFTAIRRFQTLKSIKSGPITTNGLRKIVAKFEQTGSFDMKRVEEGNQFRLRQWKMQLQHYKNRRTVMLE